MITTRALLLAAADFFERHPDRWIQHVSARNKDGKTVFATGPEAYCFCLDGRLRSLSDDGRAYDDAEYALFPHVGNDLYWFWNDRPGRTVAEVITVLRQAAAALP